MVRFLNNYIRQIDIQIDLFVNENIAKAFFLEPLNTEAARSYRGSEVSKEISDWYMYIAVSTNYNISVDRYLVQIACG